MLSYQNGAVDVNVAIKLLFRGQVIETSVGRVMLNDILPEELQFMNEEMIKKNLKTLMSRILETRGQDEAARFADRLKDLSFHAVSKSGMSWAWMTSKYQRRSRN